VVEAGLLDRLTIGDHVCWAVDDDRIRMRSLAGYFRAGLRAGQKIIYCGDDTGAVLAGVDSLGIDTAAAIASGQLAAHPPGAAYVAGGVFDPVAMLVGWRRTIDRTRAEGFPGLRVLGDMAWASRGVPGAERLPSYEAEINRYFVDHDVVGVCAYDTRIFDPLLLRRITWSHSGAASTGAPFDPQLSLRVRRTLDPLGVRISGEADLANRDALRAIIEHLFADAADAAAGSAASGSAASGSTASGSTAADDAVSGGAGEVTVDVGGLRFADRAAVRILVSAAAGGRRVRLVGCSPALIRLLDFDGVGATPGLTIHTRR